MSWILGGVLAVGDKLVGLVCSFLKKTAAADCWGVVMKTFGIVRDKSNE